ncbi:MAG: hypothetical protein QOI31_203 [Solirubrobacterales bacterium]|nr:hypothetical protein [Solirubrobacterales bacterium]
MDNPTPGSQLKASITDATLKIESIIDDAERAASDIRAEAREEAERESRRIVSEGGAQLASVLEPLIKRVESLRVESAALMHELEAATLELVDLTKRTAEPVPADVSASPAPVIGLKETAEAEVEEPPVVEEAPVASLTPGPTPVAYPGTGADSNDASAPPEEAVLRATQMAVAGSSRSEIEATLSDEFGLADATPVVNDILGPA